MLQEVRVVSLLMLFALTSLVSVAQLRFSVWSNNYLEVTSYLGKTTSDRFNTFQFDLNGLGIDQSNWSLAVRLVSPIEIISGGGNRSGKPFPPDKISFRWTGDNNNPVFRLDDIGANRNAIFLQNSNDVVLVNRSRQPINSNGSYYAQYLLYGALTVAQGNYLDDYLSPNQYTYLKYRIPVLFTLYNGEGKVLGTQQLNYEMQLAPRLTDGEQVGVEPDYGLEIAAEASDATLQFLTQKDYVHGVHLQIMNAIRINSITDYELRVKSVDSDIVRNEGGGLPLSVLSIQLRAGSGVGPLKSNPLVVLSTAEQLAVASSSSDKKKVQTFHVDYRANLTREQVLKAKPGSYSVSLLYLLMPQ